VHGLGLVWAFGVGEDVDEVGVLLGAGVGGESGEFVGIEHVDGGVVEDWDQGEVFFDDDAFGFTEDGHAFDGVEFDGGLFEELVVDGVVVGAVVVAVG